MRHTFGDVQAVAQLEGVEQIGIEHAGGISNAHALEALLQFCQLINGFLHQLWRTVDTAAFFHGQTHFIADLRPVLVTFLIDQRFQTLLDISHLCVQRGAIGLTGCCRTFHRFFTGHAAKDDQLCQRV
ncbi:hypothetical protein D3C72_1713230 [compost metagenome]